LIEPGEEGTIVQIEDSLPKRVLGGRRFLAGLIRTDAIGRSQKC
jgi:hypothetical protein